MRFLNIEKCGIANAVDEAQFEAIYRPAGWKIVGEEENPIQTSAPDDEIVIKNTNRMKRQTEKKFDDGLIKKQD